MVPKYVFICSGGGGKVLCVYICPINFQFSIKHISALTMIEIKIPLYSVEIVKGEVSPLHNTQNLIGGKFILKNRNIGLYICVNKQCLYWIETIV